MNGSDSWRNDPYVQSHPQTAAFWEAAADGRFLLPRCDACHRFHWYPRPFCPHCHGDSVQWVAGSGRGQVHAASRLHRKSGAYVVAYVQLDEGPIMLTNLLDCELADAPIGRAVRVVFRPAPEGRMLPMFVPLDGA